jgi:hypothetical protein
MRFSTPEASEHVYSKISFLTPYASFTRDGFINRLAGKLFHPTRPQKFGLLYAIDGKPEEFLFDNPLTRTSNRAPFLFTVTSFEN